MNATATTTTAADSTGSGPARSRPATVVVTARRMTGLGLTAHRDVLANLLAGHAETSGVTIATPPRISIAAIEPCPDPAYTDEVWVAEADVIG